jgi:3-isopropylmalate/(R)-2-methylmalate dehydratase small subunit
MTKASSRVERASGRALPVRGDDIDTDRIIPARFLKTITFDGLGDHLFEDDRKEVAAAGGAHPVDRPEHRGAAIMIVQANFGCGSSREHAPQAIARWGIRALIGESFSEIFFGNSVMMGLPCVTASRADIERLLGLSEAHPETDMAIDLTAMTNTAGALTIGAGMPDGARSSLLTGNWDGTSLLLDHYDDVERVAGKLPYVTGHWA